MAKNYEVGGKYYLPVTVEEVVNTNYGVKISFEDGACKDTTRICEVPDVLQTAHEIAADIHYRRNKEKDDRLEEMGGEIKVLKSENERLSKQNEELGAKVDNLEAELNNARAAIDLLQEENKKLKREVAERDELLSDAADRIKTLEEAADRSIFFEKIANQQEVIDALVEKIRRLKGDD